MKCKICNTRFSTSPQLGTFMILPNCDCGKIRVRERLRGCKKCGSQGISIQIKKHWYGYLLFCTCGKKWRVRK